MYRDDINNIETKQEVLDLIEEENLTNWLDLDEDIELDDIKPLLIEALEDNGYWIETAQDDILDSVYNGNWNEGAKIMLDEHISIYNLIEFIEESELDYEWFDLTQLASLMESLSYIKNHS